MEKIKDGTILFIDSLYANINHPIIFILKGDNTLIQDVLDCYVKIELPFTGHEVLSCDNVLNDYHYHRLANDSEIDLMNKVLSLNGIVWDNKTKSLYKSTK